MKTVWTQLSSSPRLTLLVLHSFFSGLFVAVFFSVANAEFVSAFGSDFLPVGYLSSGITGFLLIKGYRQLLKKGSYRTFLGALVFMLALTLAFRFILYLPGDDLRRWMSLPVFLCAMPFLALSGIQQAGVMLKIYDLGESKKFAGIVNAGATLSSIAGYFSIPLLLPLLDSRFDLFYLAAASLVASLWVLQKINANFTLDGEKITAKKTVPEKESPLRTLLSEKFLRYIALCSVLAMVSFYFVDYSFLLNAKSQVSSPTELAALIGTFFGTIKVAELVLSLFAGNIFRHFGLRSGILVTPAACAITALISVIIVVAGDTFSFIALIFLLKFFERVFSKSLEETSYKNLYLLVDEKSRLSTQARIDGQMKQIGTVLGSLMLILFGVVTPDRYQETALLFVALPVFLYWLLTAAKLTRAFREKLQSLLHAGLAREKSSLPRNALARMKRDHMVSLLFGAGKQNEPVPDRPYGKYDRVVPAPPFAALVSERGLSRMEILLDGPLFVLPPAGNEPVSPEKVNRIHPPIEKQADILPVQLTRVLEGDFPVTEKKMLLRDLAASKSPETLGVILYQLENPDYEVRNEVLSALEMREYKTGPDQETRYRAEMERTFSNVAFVVAALASLPQSENFEDLRSALLEEESVLKKKLLSVLTWKYDRTAVAVIRDAIVTAHRSVHDKSILALELIDNLVDDDFKARLLLVFENTPHTKRALSLNRWYYYPPQGAEQCIIAVLHFDFACLSTWTKACALMTAISAMPAKGRESICAFLYHPHPLLRAISAAFAEGPDVQAKNVPPAAMGERSQRSSLKMPVDKVFRLAKTIKRNRLFSHARGNELLEMAINGEFREHQQLQAVVSAAKKTKNACLIPDGNVILEFGNTVSPDMFQWQCVAPAHYRSGMLSAVLLREAQGYYEIPPDVFAAAVLSTGILPERSFAAAPADQR